MAYGAQYDDDLPYGVAPGPQASSSAGLTNIQTGGAPTTPIPGGTVLQPGVNPVAAAGYSGGKDLHSLLAFWKQNHPASNPDMNGFLGFLKQNGVDATRATHAGGQLSDDKFVINGQMMDFGSSFGAADGKWFDDPMADGGGGGGDNAVDASYLAPYTKQFTPGADAALPTFQAPADATLPPGFKAPDAAKLPDFQAPTDSALPTFQGPGDFKAPTAADVLKDPSYLFRRDQGADAIQNSAAAKGMTNSGGSLVDIMNYGQQAASQEYGNVWNRDFNAWNGDWTHALETYGAGTDRANTSYARAKGEYGDLTTKANTEYGRGMDAYKAAVDRAGSIWDRAVGSYGLNTTRANTSYDRDFGQFKDERDQYYANQDRPYDKLFKVANLGAQAAMA